jgi:hypothetical protein
MIRNSFVISIALITIVLIMTSSSCSKEENINEMNIIFLHHSTGRNIWKGYKPSIITRGIHRINSQVAQKLMREPRIPIFFERYNKKNGTNYSINAIEYPKVEPYGWNNYPYDYYNIWVKNAGIEKYLEEPTLEILTNSYDVIIFKHCYPSSKILPDNETPDINSDIKTLENYKLQYNAIKEKIHEFPNKKFILFTGAVHVKYYLTEEEAKRAKEFHEWVVNEWDLPDDNIYLWDLYELQTEGGLYFKDEYAVSEGNSHPNFNFSKKAAKLLFNRIIDVIETNGKTTTLTGHQKS